MKPVLLIGEHNPLSINRRYALYDRPEGCAGHRLRTRILGLRRSTYLGPMIHRTNLCVGSWRSDIATRVAADLVRSQRRECAYSAVVLLGVKVREAFGVDVSAFRHVRVGGMILAALPHPSGRTRDWNEPMATHVARCLMRDLAPHVPWGESL